MDSADVHAAFLRSRRFPALDGLRAVSIAGVILHHTCGQATGILSRGRLGVELFFVISGFLITTLLLREARQDGIIQPGWNNELR